VPGSVPNAHSRKSGLRQSRALTHRNARQAVAVSRIVDAYSLAIAAGGDASATPAPACAAVSNANAASDYQPVATLEAIVAANPGTPCIDGTTTDTAGANDLWSNSTISLRSIANRVTPPNADFTTSELVRVAFATSGNGVTSYRCLDCASNGSSRNCTAIGRGGTYSIQTLGDARVLTMSNQPPEAPSHSEGLASLVDRLRPSLICVMA
jgi:hypothetical protein